MELVCFVDLYLKFTFYIKPYVLAITVLHIFEIKIVNSAHLYTTKT